MLYRDYSRKAGEWVPNRHGGRENLEAIEFLRRTNHLVGTQRPEAVMLAEESTAFPAVTRPPSDDLQGGGLGFHYKWNMGWMNDVLAYMARDPIHRRHHHDQIRFSLMYAFSENFVLPFSHDEVVHGKGSLLGKMPGDDWQKFANLRLMYGFMWGHPGKKLLFMGCEFAPWEEWNADRALPWQLLEHAPTRACSAWCVTSTGCSRPARPSTSSTPRRTASAGSTTPTRPIRSSSSSAAPAAASGLVLCNFTPVVRHGWRIGVPQAGTWAELINTDADVYGGSNVVNGPLASEPVPWQGQAQSVQLTLPPLATLMLVRRG
jgi:1,4-alpha-glucan branching enzyme